MAWPKYNMDNELILAGFLVAGLVLIPTMMFLVSFSPLGAGQ